MAVMTNSLATTDEPLVHFGYARYRDALLDMGVALYEMMPGVDAHAEPRGRRRTARWAACMPSWPWSTIAGCRSAR